MITQFKEKCATVQMHTTSHTTWNCPTIIYFDIKDEIHVKRSASVLCEQVTGNPMRLLTRGPPCELPCALPLCKMDSAK